MPSILANALRHARNALAAGNGWPALAIILILCVAFRLPPDGGVAPAHGDVPSYLAAAYNLRTSHTYTMALMSGPATPAIGREPGYPLFLAAIMAIDPNFGGFTPACLAENLACPAATYRTPSLANAALILAAGIAVFLLARRVCGSPIAGLAAAAYLLLNSHFNKAWGDLMSDRLAVFLTALAMLALAAAWQKPKHWRFALTGAAFAALTLTKAIFLPFCIVAWLTAAAITIARRNMPAHPRRRTALLATASMYCFLVGGWVLRNWEISGMARLTDARSGIALSTREVFDTMSPREYAASLVYWTGGAGPKFAKTWFGAETANRFNLDMPGSYYDLGQHGYMRRVHDVQATENITFWQAAAQTDQETIRRIRQHFAGFLVTMLPLTYRGLWVDEFLFVGIPCLGVAFLQAIRGRNGLLLILLSLGLFNIIAYAAISLNMQRYQMTALPAIALAVACVSARPGSAQAPSRKPAPSP